MMKRPNFQQNPFSKGSRNVLVIALIFMLSLYMLTKMTDYARETKVVSYSTFLNAIEREQVKSVHISGQDIVGSFKDGNRFETVATQQESYLDLLRKHGVEVTFASAANQMNVWYLLFFGALLAGVGVIWYLMRQNRGSNGGPGGIFSIGKSRAKVSMPATIKENFESVAGAYEAKRELKDIVDFLKNSEKYRRLGAKIPRGILLVGEPGNGKTLLAKAVAGEANCPFFSITGSDFIEVFVGVGAARVRDLFAQARKQAPSIVFIDEIDAIGRQRGSGVGGGHDEREQTLNQLLTEMDGFEQHPLPVIVMAATNMPEVLDKALLRPGRFDRSVTVPYPDEDSREQILRIHARGMKIADDVNFRQVAITTSGFSGADLANLLNKAALIASKHNQDTITMQDLTQAHTELLESNSYDEDRRGQTAARGSSRSRMFMPSQVKVKFDDVAGADEAKEELREIVDFLKRPDHFKRLGAKLPHGALLVGNPGNGKTLLAKAVAGEANCPFFSVSASEFIEMYVGVGASRVRDLFAQARRHKPSIIFIDEIDAIGMRRSNNDGGGAQEYNQTLNQLLTEMDGFNTSNYPVIVLAATNRPEILDPALMRPGRFDKRVEVPYPNLENREKILRVHARTIKMDDSVDLKVIARATPGFSGADLANLVNEAALHASKDPLRETVNKADFAEARDKIIMGKEMRSTVMSSEECRVTAYHEAGHALARILLKDTDPLYKVTIVPRGFSLGSTHSLPETDVHMRSREEMLGSIKTALGGRAAELVVFGKMMTGASNDFEKATDIARQMVCHYGMSTELGPVVYDQSRGAYRYSEYIARKIDETVHQLLESAHKETVELIEANREMLEKMALALLEKETLDAHEIYTLLGLEIPKNIQQRHHEAAA
jgi:cell division protease FtsH